MTLKLRSCPALSLLLVLACDSPPPKENAAAKPEPAAAKAEPAAKAESEIKPEAAPAKAPEPAAKPEPVRAKFPELTGETVLLKPEMVRGQLRAPKGAKLGRNINGWQDLSTKAYAMVVRESFDSWDKIKEELGEIKVVIEEPETLVYEKDGGFGFVQIVDRKGPEELEGEADMRFECRNGAAMDWAISKKPKMYPREQVDIMVASCRTLQLQDL